MALLGKMYILDIAQGICSGTSSDATFKNFAESYSCPYINNIIANKNSLINIFCLENILNRHDGRKEAFFYVFMLDKSHQE